jgi:hypothetical protein
MSPETFPLRTRIITIGSVVLVLGLIVFAGAYWMKRRAANQAVADAGNNIHKLIVAADQGKISGAERDSAIQQSIRSQLSQQIDGYFNLPEGKPRKDYLDKIIDDQEKIRGQLGPINVQSGPTTNESGTGTTVKTTPTPDGKGQNVQVTVRKKGDPSELPPDLRARVAEFSAAVAKRRAERGLPPGPGGVVIIKTSDEVRFAPVKK